MPLTPSTDTIGLPFIELQTVDSTNKYAMARIHAGMAQHGTAVFSHEQTRGKGQRGKSWASEKDANMALSIILNPYPLVVSEQFQLSVAMSVSLHEFFSGYAGDETKIKWPNDLYWRDRKAGGILIENIIRAGNWEWAVAGSGININQTDFHPELPNPVSLKQISGKQFNPLTLAKELCQVIDKNYRLLMKGGFGQLFNTYQSILYKKEEIVKLRKDSRVFEAAIKGVTESGQLITYHTIEEYFDFGELEWVL